MIKENYRDTVLSQLTDCVNREHAIRRLKDEISILEQRLDDNVDELEILYQILQDFETSE